MKTAYASSDRIRSTAQKYTIIDWIRGDYLRTQKALDSK